MEPAKQELESLEDLLRQNPESPVFARLASHYLQTGEYLHALALCDRGTSLYPEYATGFLLKARALRHLNQYDEALESYRRVLDILPRCSVAAHEMSEIQLRVKEVQAPDEKLSQDRSDAQQETPEDVVEQLAERLRDYKPKRGSLADTGSEKQVETDGDKDELPIVSETLAEIFVRQKQYQRAIEAYGQLIKRKPEKADIYLTKINEVKELKEKERE
jgi:tetratricopeptide (TPR) repeat protein